MLKDTQRVRVVKIHEHKTRAIEDDIVVEEPLEIRLNGESLAVTMRTPGYDFDLAVGFLLTEGFIQSAGEVGTIAYCPNEENKDLKNVLEVTLLDRSRSVESKRRLWASSSCGLCGKATLDSIRQVSNGIESSLSLDVDILYSFPARLRAAQSNFSRTGGIHAAGLFNQTGRLLWLREDIGRHNAVDKVLGASIRASGVPLSEYIMMVSGRLGFEIAQKALVAGIPVVASVSAPSSLSVELAQQFGITAIGFLRGQALNIYTHPDRIRTCPIKTSCLKAWTGRRSLQSTVRKNEML